MNINLKFERPYYKSARATIRSSFERIFIQWLSKCRYTKENPLVLPKGIKASQFLDSPGFIDSVCFEVLSVWVEKPRRFNGKPVIGFSVADGPDNVFVDTLDEKNGEQFYFYDLEGLKDAIHSAALKAFLDV